MTAGSNHRHSNWVEMWRCRECGKWSHAKRRPLRHKRFAGDSVFLSPEDERRIAETSEYREHDTGAYGDVVWVWCGPFDRYEARHSDHATPPALDVERLPKPKEARDRFGIADEHANAEVPF